MTEHVFQAKTNNCCDDTDDSDVMKSTIMNFNDNKSKISKKKFIF